jgi:peptide/nickel transport system substrate-binding protein
LDLKEKAMTRLTRRHALAAAGALAGSLAAPTAFAQRGKDTVVIGMSLEPPVLDPTKNAASAVREVTYQNVYETLTRIGRNGEILPGLAESWSVDPDGLAYTFKLRAGVKFHDGEPCDANDVKFSLDRLFAADSTAPAKSLYTTFQSVEAPDPATVKITLKSGDAFLLYNVGIGDAAIMGRKSAATNDVKPIGTGPFMFKERKEGDSLVLVRAPTWRDPASVKLNTIIFKFIKDPSAQVNALLAGDVDTFPGFQAPELVERIRRDPRFAVVIGTSEGETILSTNNSSGKPASNLKVRQAIAHAIDRKELIDAQSGFGTPIGSHFAPHNPAYIDLTRTYPFDIARAKALMAEAGFAQGFDATLKLPPVGYAQRSGEVIVSQLGKIGVRLKIVQLEWAQWLKEVFRERDYDFSIVAHTEANDIDRYARDGYYWNYNSAAFRKAYAEMVQIIDPAKRTEQLRRLQKIIADDAVNGYLYQLAKVGIWKKELVGMWENSPTPAIDMTQVSWK